MTQKSPIFHLYSERVKIALLVLFSRSQNVEIDLAILIMGIKHMENRFNGIVEKKLVIVYILKCQIKYSLLSIFIYCVKVDFSEFTSHESITCILRWHKQQIIYKYLSLITLKIEII